MTKRKAWLVVAVTAVATLAQAACGSEGDAGSSGLNLTKPPIVIGMANATTGPHDAQQAAANEDVAKAWQKWVNDKKGGINGHPVKVVFRDTKNDPAASTSAANQLINEEKVVAEVGGADSVTASVWVPIFSQAKVAVIGGQIVDDAILAENPYYYPTIATITPALPLMMDAAKASGASAITGVVCAEAPSCKQAEPIWQARSETLGMKWDGLTQVRSADANYTAACLTIKQANANFIQVGVNYATATRVVTDCSKQQLVAPNYGFLFGTFDGKLADLSKKTGANFVGVFGGVPWFMDSPGAKDYRDAMDGHGKAVPENPVQGDTWNGLEMFRRAMAGASDNPTAAEVADSLSKIKDDDIGGLLPQKVSYSPVGTPNKPLTCMWGAEIQKGELVNPKAHCPAT